MEQQVSAPDGQPLGPYRLLEKIGEGGMGVVYRAWDTRLDRQVALKLLKRDALLHDASRARLLREARVASSINHPHIATIYGLEQIDGSDAIVMEFVPGRTLRERLRSGPMELRDVLDVALAVADGLGEAHARGVVHRDVKPDNIIITPRGYPKIMDFGLAKVVRAERAPQGDGTAPTQLTAEGVPLGTVAYMSPEQALGKSLTPQTDVFSFGLVLYEMLTQQPAFSGDSEVDILYEILHHDPRPISELNPNVPADLQAIVSRCTAKEPDERYPSGREVYDDLKLARTSLELQRARTLHTLLTISREMASILDLEPLLERVAALVKSLIDYDVLGIFRVDEASNRLVWVGGAGYVPERVRRTEYAADRGLCGRAIRTREPVRVGDVQQDPDYYAPNGEPFAANLAVPLIHKEQVIAVLNMECRRPHFFTSEHVTVMSTLAGPIAAAIATADLFEERRRHVLAMEMLHEISREVSSILDLDSLLARAGELTRKVIDYDLFAIFSLDAEAGAFSWLASIGYHPALVHDRRLRLGEGVISRAAAERRAVIVDDASRDPDHVAARTPDGRLSRSELAVPLIAKEQVLGVLVLESAEPGHFKPEHADLAGLLAGQLAVAIENARLYGEVHDRVRAREEETERIRRRFESYVTPHVAEQLFRDPQGSLLAGERRPVTVLVADLRGFTSIAETLPPGEVVRFLQEFFSVASHLVFKYEGTVDKFMGDALMAFYGAPIAHDPRYGPSDAQRAVFAALDIRDAFRRLRDRWWERHAELGAVELGVGINTGTCLLGNMGTDKRVEYTAIGEAVNQAFQLCREAAPGEIRIGGGTHADVHEDVRVEPVGRDRPTSDPQAHVVVGLKYL
jgi:serine/threonine protein kinase/class 3 adenylate cyclase